jgi:hypothetical protein
MGRITILHSAHAAAIAILLAVAWLGAGCASNGMQAQWSDPQFAGRSLKGAKVLVVCDAAEVALQRICEDQVASRLGGSGVNPVRAADAGLAAGPAKPDRVLDAARSAGAAAIFTSAIAPDATVASPRPSIGIGIGGFGGSHSGVGGGVGVSVPVGTGRVSTAYGASMSLIDTGTGKLMWSGRATAAASNDVAAQIGKLTDQGIRSVQKAGLL